MKFLLKTFFILLNFSLGLEIWAACTSPAGEAGKIIYDSSIMKYCDDTNWVDMCPTSGCSAGAACSTAGKMEYNTTSDEYRWCNGTNEFLMGDSTGATCTSGEEGKLSYDSTEKVMTFCNGANLIHIGKDVTPTVNNFFVLTSTAYDGNFGGLSGADTQCVSDLSANDFTGKSGRTINSTNTKAWLCDGSSCQDLLASTTYSFAVSGSTSVGGATFTTDASGYGPGNSDDWSQSTFFGASYYYYANRTNIGATTWGVHSSFHCVNWSSNAGTDTGGFGDSAQTDVRRWLLSRTGCNLTRRLVCQVNF